MIAIAQSLLALAPLAGNELELSAVDVYPQSIALESARDAQRLLVLGTLSDGTQRDFTSAAQVRVENPEVAVLVDGELLPRGDGATELIVELEGQERRVPIEVSARDEDPALSFRLDVLPVLTARGCNAGSCHGAARGQDGFHLSLFGFDPAGDYERLTRELPTRRLDLAFPDESLLLSKPTGAVPHTGGRLFEPESPEYGVLSRWVREGARDDGPELASVTAIDLFPPEALLSGAGNEVQFVVRAHYSDGTDRDVTELALLRSSNEACAAIDASGRLLSADAGEAYVTANFGVHAVGVPVVVLPSDASSDYADPAEGAHPANYIDELVETKQRKLRLSPSGLCSDEEFVRRVHLDVLGLLPTPEERARFLADERPDRRAHLVAELVERVEFTQLWVMKWAELLQIRSSNDVSEKSALLYFEWLRDRIAQNMPVDEMVRRILTASGGTFSNPPTNYYQIERETTVLAENVAQSFLGVRLQCAQCHNHPFDRWTQDDYYAWTSFFAQVGRKRGEDYRERIIFNRRRGEVNHPVSNEALPPRFLGGEEPDIDGRDRREVVADWLTSPDNPWFARTLANRVWAHFLGPGIVEPVDDLRVSNPPSNGPLLDALAARLVESEWDFKALVRDICNSRTYQRSTEATPGNAHDERNYTHASVRRLRAETLLDVVCQVTGVPSKFQGLPLGARAVEIADGATDTYFLRTFGRAPRETVCACEVSDAPSLSQALHLLNGNAVHQKIVEGGLVPALLESGARPMEVVDELYLLCLGRGPDADERVRLAAELLLGSSEQAALEDLFWALLNSSEFLFQH